MKNVMIMLDIDGVLNNLVWEESVFEEKGYVPYDRMELCPRNIQNLAFIINTLKSYYDKVDIILSSSWRWQPDTLCAARTQLAKYNLSIIDTTQKELFFNISRSAEIRDYIQKHPEYENYLILDDEKIDEDLKPFHIQTTLTYGLTYELAEKAIKLMCCKELL